MSKWISVKERLPENTGEVLVWPSFYGRPSVARFWAIARSWQQTNVTGDVNEYVTHWMPLPDPPEEVK